MTTLKPPVWRGWSLAQHHEKHCVDEPDCFQDVLDSTVQVAQNEYEIASERASMGAALKSLPIRKPAAQGTSGPVFTFTMASHTTLKS